jgi:hypothetical protein
METQSRERISIDLQGLKEALMERSQALGVSPSELLRKALLQALEMPAVQGRAAAVRPSMKRPPAATQTAPLMATQTAPPGRG